MPTPKSKRTIVLQSSNHDSELDSLRDEDYSGASLNDTILSGSGSDFRSRLGIINTGNNPDVIIGGYSEIRPISEILPLPPGPNPSSEFITGSNSIDSINSSGQDTELGVGVGDDYLNARFSDTSSPLPFPATNPSPAFTDARDDEPSFQFNGFPGLSILGDSSGGNGSSESDDADTLIGNYFEPSLYLTITTSNDLFPSMAEGTTSDRLIGTLGGNDTITGVGYSDGNNSLESAPRDTIDGGGMDEINLVDGSSGDDSPNRNDQTLIEPHTDQLFSSGVGSLETTIFLPAVQKVREAAARSSGASSSDGAWALGSTFELTSEESFSSQTETSGRTYIGPGGPTFWPPRPNKEVTVF